MTDLSSIISSMNTSSTTTSGSSQTLSADMNTFLTMLTTQLQYQDPLDPMDTAEYTNQLVQYSSVEQAIQTNKKLDNLLNLSIYNLGVQATGYVGKTVQVLGNTMPLEGGVGKATYTLSKNVQECTILVRDLDGNVVYSEAGSKSAGTYDFLWDGKDTSGKQLADGAYQITVTTSVPDGETAADVTTTVFGKVTGVASDESGIYIGLGNAVTATLDNVVTSRDEKYWDELIASIKNDSGSSSEDEDNTDSILEKALSA
ncbi:MAG: flagellar hook assembly protein FlgD [Alphaproteobacteria bacterium]|nr:flagellar hook assembly protein FlgD [Alphaproteobacteria bacterium]